MTAAEFVYTVLLRPKPLRALANAAIRRFIPPRLELQGSVLILNQNDPVVSGALALGVYEKAETKFFREGRSPDMVFLDIGANIGYFSALALEVLEKGSIIALEPDPENFRFLERTIAANPSKADRVRCINKAAADRNGTFQLHTSSSNRGDNRLYSNDRSEGSVEVEVCTIDSLLESIGISSVDFIKIDVQGFEGHVFRGMRRILQSSPNLTVLSEFWPHGLRGAGSDPEELLREWEALGLTLYELTPQGSITPLGDKKKFVQRFSDGQRYTNIVGLRGNTPIRI